MIVRFPMLLSSISSIGFVYPEGRIGRFLVSFVRKIERVWSVALIVLSYYYSREGQVVVASVFAMMGLAMQIAMIVEQYRMTTHGSRRGLIQLAAFPERFGVGSMLRRGVMIALSYGAIYYAMSSYNPHSFSTPLSIIDSIYFSVITAATVGFGDISPTTALAKVVFVSEICTSFVFVIIVLQTVMIAWQKLNFPEDDRTLERRNSGEPEDEPYGDGPN